MNTKYLFLLALLLCLVFSSCTQEDFIETGDSKSIEKTSDITHFCGFIPSDATSSRYAVSQYKWRKNDLSYFIKNTTSNLSVSTQKQIFKEAFNTWSVITPLNFTEVFNESNADIIISFEASSMFSLAIVHARASFPNSNNDYTVIQFNNRYTWTVGEPGPYEANLSNIALHEIGHTIGMRHSDSIFSIMYPEGNGSNETNRFLSLDDIAGIQSLYGGRTGVTTIGINEYNVAHGWKLDKHPRTLADVNGDGKADIIGFGNEGTYISLSNGSSSGLPSLWIREYGYNQAWRVDRHPRAVADVNGDGKADIIGFGYKGTYVSLSNGSGFEQQKLWISNYGYNQGWRVDRHPRAVADVNGDGKADVIGFGNEGTYVSISNGTSFRKPRLWIHQYGYNQDWRVDKHPRTVSDVNGDGKADIVGFGNEGTYVSLSNGFYFGSGALWIHQFGYNQGWRVDEHPRVVANVNDDGRGDIIGFGNEGAYTSLSNGNDAFSSTTLKTHYFGYHDDAGRWRNIFPRTAADFDGDGKAEIIGFGYEGVGVFKQN